MPKKAIANDVLKMLAMSLRDVQRTINGEKIEEELGP